MARQGASTWDELEAEEAQGKVQEGYGMALLPPPSTSKSSKNRRPRVRQSLYAEACATRMVQGVKIRQFYIEAGNYSAGNWHRKSGHLSRKCNSRQGAIDELAVLMQQEFLVKGVHKNHIPYVPHDLYHDLCSSFSATFDQDLSVQIHTSTSHPYVADGHITLPLPLFSPDQSIEEGVRDQVQGRARALGRAQLVHAPEAPGAPVASAPTEAVMFSRMRSAQ